MTLRIKNDVLAEIWNQTVTFAFIIHIEELGYKCEHYNLSLDRDTNPKHSELKLSYIGTTWWRLKSSISLK
jgi:hypothetical protein